MTQITVTHESTDQQEVKFEITGEGVCVKWPHIIGGDEGICVSWVQMENPEELCKLFDHMQVRYFVQIAKWLAEAYQKRAAYQAVVW